jgi:hypothetical protein
MRYNTTRAIRVYIRLYGRWTYNEITIVPPLTNMYGKIYTVVVFDAPKNFQGRSTGAEVLVSL